MPDTAAVGLRERKKAQTRELIETTALELFSRRGFEATTVEAITEACAISSRTFFRYFGSKHDVLNAGVQARHRRLAELLAGRPVDEAPLHSLREALRVLARECGRDRHNVLLRAQVVSRNPGLAVWAFDSQQAWHQAIAGALADRMSALDLRLAAAAAGGALLAAVDLWQSDGGTGDLEALTVEAFDRLGGGLDG